MGRNEGIRYSKIQKRHLGLSHARPKGFKKGEYIFTSDKTIYRQKRGHNTFVLVTGEKKNKILAWAYKVGIYK